MTIQTRLRWWVVCWLSIFLTMACTIRYGDFIVGTDPMTLWISVGVVAIYAVVSTWIGFSIHTGRKVPTEWARYAAGLLQSLGLIGALFGMVQLFGLTGGTVDDSAAILHGLGLLLFSTLTGMIYSEFLIMQLRVCGE